MNWHNVNEIITQAACAIMLVAVFAEVVARTIIISISAVRRAWKER